MSHIEVARSAIRGFNFLHTPNPVGRLVFALTSSWSLTQANPTVDIYRDVYQSIAATEERGPLNEPENMFYDLVEIIHQRGGRLDDLSPYWLKENAYKPTEVFGTLIQVLDYHNAPLPTTTLPPERDVKKYIQTVLESDHRVTIPQQLEILLEITKNNLVGAANLGCIANRIMARGLDSRAYPSITVQEKELRAWNEKLAQFETYNNNNKSDAPGDTYYFWTQFFSSLYINLYEGLDKHIYDVLFAHGREIMQYVRKTIASTPINADHYEASMLGRQCGLGIAEEVKSGRLSSILAS